MKKIGILFILSSLFCITSFGQSSNAGGKYVGSYTYEVPGPITYDLKIRNDNSCVYEGVGIQTFFEIECKGKVNGDTYEIYYVKTIDGMFQSEDDWNKSLPIIILSYKNNILYTAEPLYGELPSSKKFKKRT
jgi:hypothetical protein